jgi:hypothetical protein
VVRLVRIQLSVREYPVDIDILQRLSALAGEIAEATGHQNFHVPVKVELDVGEGSLKVLSVVVGMLMSGYYFIGNYKAFKEGVVEMCHDANKYGDDFCDKFLEKVGIKKSQVLRQKVDVLTPEQLRRFLEEVEALDDAQTVKELNSPVLKDDNRFVRLARARSKIDQILRTLDSADKELVTGSLVFESLPPYTQWPRERDLPEPLRYALKPEARKFSGGPREMSGLTSSRKRRAKLHVKTSVFVAPRATRAPLRGS